MNRLIYLFEPHDTIGPALGPDPGPDPGSDRGRGVPGVGTAGWVLGGCIPGTRLQDQPQDQIQDQIQE